MSSYVLAFTGASAQPVGERALKLLLLNGYKVDLILSKGAYEVWNYEHDIKIPIDPNAQEKFWKERLNVNTDLLRCHRWNNNAANIASGSNKTKAMIIVPCSMGTIGRIAGGYCQDLISRSADVHLKEKRPLLLAPRETPFSHIHLRNLSELSSAGATIVPLIPAWYIKPKTIEEIIDFLVSRLFDSLDLDLTNIKRWKGD